MHRFWKLGTTAVAALSCGGSVALHHKGVVLRKREASDSLDAVRNINKSRDITRSVATLEKLHNSHSSQLKRAFQGLNSVGWTQLAIHSETLFQYYPYQRTTNEEDFTTLMKRIELNKSWSRALRWYFDKFCADDDLMCQDTLEPARRDKSKRHRIYKVLQVLFYLSEFEDCEKMVKQHVPTLLRMILHNYRDDQNHELIILLLKTVANIAGYSKFCAEMLIEDGWLPVLAEMCTSPQVKVEPLLSQKVLKNLLHSIGDGVAKLPVDVYEFHCSEEEPKVDVVFVHGFRGSVFRTWRQKDGAAQSTTQFWPMDWLPHDLHQPVRILGIDYATKFLKFGKVMDSIGNRSQIFNDSLTEIGVGQRPVVFICHSMGGLLVKHMLIHNPELRNATVAILFMATPHRGSPVVTNLHNFLRPTDDLKLLHIDSDDNKRLHENFLRVAPYIPIVQTVVETETTPIFGAHRVIVPAQSAFFGRGALYHAAEHHHNICKPSTKESLSYCVILNIIKDALNT